MSIPTKHKNYCFYKHNIQQRYSWGFRKADIDSSLAISSRKQQGTCLLRLFCNKIKRSREASPTPCNKSTTFLKNKPINNGRLVTLVGDYNALKLVAATRRRTNITTDLSIDLIIYLHYPILVNANLRQLGETIDLIKQIKEKL